MLRDEISHYVRNDRGGLGSPYCTFRTAIPLLVWYSYTKRGVRPLFLSTYTFLSVPARSAKLKAPRVVARAFRTPAIHMRCYFYLLAGGWHAGKKVLATIFAACALVTGVLGLK